MKTLANLLSWKIAVAIAVLGCAQTALAQNPKLNIESLSKLDAKASTAVNITLQKDMLGLAAKVLGNADDDPDAKRIKELVAGITEITVRSYEFENPGEYAQSDVDGIRSQLRGGGWSQLVNVHSRRDGDNAEVYAMMQGEKMLGLAILCVEPKELTVVNIVGSVDVARLSELGGEFGIPRVELKRDKTPGH